MSFPTLRHRRCHPWRQHGFCRFFCKRKITTMSRRTSSHEPFKNVPSRVAAGSAAASSSGSYLKDGLSDPDIGPLIVANGDPRSIEALAATSRGTRDIAESVKRERAEFCWPNKESCTTPKQDCSIKCDSVASFQSSMIELCENGCVDVSLYDAEHPWEDHVSRSSMRQIFRCTKTLRHIHSTVALLRHAIASGALAQLHLWQTKALASVSMEKI